MRNAGLEETEIGIKTAGRNINHQTYYMLILFSWKQGSVKELVEGEKKDFANANLLLNIINKKLTQKITLAGNATQCT